MADDELAPAVRIRWFGVERPVEGTVFVKPPQAEAESGGGVMHEAYDPNPVGHYMTYCPVCCRSVRCGSIQGVITYYRHWLDPSARYDRCANSRMPVAEAWFRTEGSQVVSRTDWETSHRTNGV